MRTLPRIGGTLSARSNTGCAMPPKTVSAARQESAAAAVTSNIESPITPAPTAIKHQATRRTPSADPIAPRDTTAAKGQARAGTVCGLFLSDVAVSTEPRSAKAPGWRSHRKIWLGIAIAAGAFAGVAAITSRGTPGETAGTVNAPQIGTPTIIIGKP